MQETRVLLLVLSCAFLWSLESLVPLYQFRPRQPRRVWPNVTLTTLVIVMYLAFSFAAASVAAIAQARGLGLLSLVALPQWIEVVVGIAALDCFAYAAHVAMHKTKMGWQFHRVHHSDIEVDVTTAFRQHPGETLWRILWQLPPILLFGIPLWVVMLYLTISGLNAQLEHANLRISQPVDRLARLLFVTPDMHKVHHSRRQRETDTNYANILSIWDRLFGTYTRRVDFATLRYGLDGLDDEPAQRLKGLLTLPFDVV